MKGIEKKLNAESLSELCQEVAIRRLILFGSYAREEEGKESDIDFLVEFNKLPGMLEFMRIRRKLEKYFNRDVDLFTPHFFDEDMLEKIKKEMKVIYESS